MVLQPEKRPWNAPGRCVIFAILFYHNFLQPCFYLSLRNLRKKKKCYYQLLCKVHCLFVQVIFFSYNALELGFYHSFRNLKNKMLSLIATWSLLSVQTRCRSNDSADNAAAQNGALELSDKPSYHRNTHSPPLKFPMTLQIFHWPCTFSYTNTRFTDSHSTDPYRGADKFLARPGRKQGTATKLQLLQATQKKIQKVVRPTRCPRQ